MLENPPKSHVLALAFSCKCSSVRCKQYWKASMRRRLILHSSVATGKLLAHLMRSIAVLNESRAAQSIKKLKLFLIGLCAVVTAKGFYT